MASETHITIVPSSEVSVMAKDSRGIVRERLTSTVVQTFLNRTGETLIEMDVLTSMREMVLHDADLVSKKLAKKMSMEFDFKRRPRSLGMIEALGGDGRTHSHIAFDTDPVSSVEEFRLTRDIWDDYRRSEEYCIKTVSDFAKFAEYMDRTRSLSDGNKRYLSKSDRDGLKRFRRDLCDAFKNGEAGFEPYQNLSNKDFCAILNDTGFQDSPAIVSVAHVENGKRQAFRPNATPPTREVLNMMSLLKSRFPELRAEDFLGALPDSEYSWMSIARRQLKR